MAWTKKIKTVQEADEEEILTPDSEKILVGEFEDLVLVYQLAIYNWYKKDKEILVDWDLKTKITD